MSTKIPKCHTRYHGSPWTELTKILYSTYQDDMTQGVLTAHLLQTIDFNMVASADASKVIVCRHVFTLRWWASKEHSVDFE